MGDKPTPPSRLKTDAPANGFDHGSRQGAKKMAARIIEYWQSRGCHGIEAWAEPVVKTRRGMVWGVRSNIGPDGFPPKDRLPGPKPALAQMPPGQVEYVHI